jgi:hypothetical protein
MNSSFANFPAQKIPKSKKTKTWYRNAIESVVGAGFFYDEGVRSSYAEKIINTNLYNGIVDIEDMERTVNPSSIDDDTTMPDRIQHYPIVNPRIEVLIGEESKRRFDWKAVVTNNDAISEKEEELNALIKEEILRIISKNRSKEEIDEEIKKLDKKVSSFQDKREKLSNRLLKHHFTEQRFDRLFNNCFKDVLINAEEYAECNIVGNKPVLTKIDPKKIFWVRSGFSNKVQDADLIILDDFWSPGRIIDHYYNDLNNNDLQKLDRGFGSSDDGDPFVNKSYRDRLSVNANFLDNSDSDIEKVNNVIGVAQQHGYNLTNDYDVTGNVRVLRVYWRGWKKVKYVTYFDKFGDEQKDIFPEDYIVKKDEGETYKTIWVNEWYQATKIGSDIYVDCKPKEIQFRSIENPAYAHPGIVGKTYSFNSSRAVSLMGKVKNYLYLYDVVHHRLNELLAANQGKILEVDFASIPNGWGIEKWFHYLKKMKIAVKDSFKEGQKGASTGKLAGGLNNASKGYLDLDQGQNIQQHIMLLEFIKREMTEVTGVSEQRMGQISNRETLGGVERSVTQSSHITEWFFAEHEEFKLDALEAFLNTCAIAYKDNPKKLQYILDTESIATLNVNPELLTTADLGILITASSKTQEIEQNIKRMAEAALSAGQATFNDIINLYMTDSLSEMKNIINRSTSEAQLEARKQSDKQNEVAMAKMQADSKLEQDKLALDERKNIRDNETKILISNSTSPEEKLQDFYKFNKELDYKNKTHSETLEQKKKEHGDKMKLEDKKLKQAKQSSNK